MHKESLLDAFFPIIRTPCHCSIRRTCPPRGRSRPRLTSDQSSPNVIRSTVHLLIRDLLRLFLLGAQVLTQPVQRLRGDDQTRGDYGLAGLDEPIAAIDVLVLIIKRFANVIFTLRRDTGRVEDGAEQLILELARRLLHDRKGLFDLTQAVVGDRVGLVHIRRHVLVWTREQRKHRLRKRLVAVVGQVDGDLPDGIRLEGRDGVVHHRIGGQMLVLPTCQSVRWRPVEALRRLKTDWSGR